MFKRTNARPAKTSANSSNQGRLNSILGDSSHVNGTMRIEGSVRIDGEYDGVISATETIVVGRTGFARADLEAREVIVAGRVEGKLIGVERIELQEGARVDGDIFSQTIAIADGVIFNGSCNMQEHSSSTAKPTPAVSLQSPPEDASSAQIQVVKSS